MGSRIKGEGGPFAKGWDSYAARSPVIPHPLQRTQRMGHPPNLRDVGILTLKWQVNDQGRIAIERSLSSMLHWTSHIRPLS